MRTILSLVVIACLLRPSIARAQTPAAAPTALTGAIDSAGSEENVAEFAVRGTSYAADSDEARYQRYRDLRNGGTLDLFRFTKATDSQWFNLQADHVGYRDQRFAASINDYGKMKASFEFNQIPLFFSQDTRTLFTTTSSGVLSLDDAVQSGLQNKTTTPTAVAALAQPFDLRLKRSIAGVKTTYSANRYLDVDVSFKSTAKTGNQPWAGTFGFSDAVELAVPVQTRTTELGLALEWASRRGSARLGYDGSFFRNDVDTLVWDNPLRVADSPTLGPVQGRMSLWPDSTMNAASATGLLNLPARSRATAYISVGSWSQNAPLVPFTINGILPLIPLDRATADAQARVTSMNYSFNSRPVDTVAFTARYRSYDFDNRTPVFHVGNTVSYDTTVAAFAEGGTSPYSLTRRTFDADVSVTPVKYSAFRAGYTREQVNQTFRSFDTTTEDTLRLSADASGLNWLMLRMVYEHAKRVGTGFDEQALDDIGEQVSLRQFDISDRTSDRVSLIMQVTPISAVAVNGTVSAGNEDRPGTVFGLRSNDNRAYSIGADFVPRKAVSLGVSYQYEKYTALQASRQANPGVQFNDPTRDWTTNGNDTVQTVSASMDLIKAIRKTDIRFAYDYSHAESLYVYGLAPNTTLPPVVQLPAVVNQLQRATVDVRYRFTPHFGAGVVYWYDKYAVNDFALGAQTLTSIAQPSFLMIGYIDRPYTANTVSGRFTYYW
jgi:MtrB/PioB family decaheme-associated outer membrane protein